METRKILGLIFSIIFVVAFAFVLSWGIINFNKVKEGLSGTELYTKEDVDNAYQDGYNTALSDKSSYDELISEYRDTITTQTDQISQLNSNVSNLTNNNKDYANQITKIESQQKDLQEQVNNLTNIKTTNQETINSLNIQIKDLENQLVILQNSNDNKSKEIVSLKNQILNLQTINNQLQKTNELNSTTITSLNAQISTLNKQISDMTLKIQNNSTTVTMLNNKISELEKSVSYYEQYISSLENGEQIVVTFEFAGSVYNLQIISPNTTCSLTNPTSTDYVKFNYWTIDNQRIDLSTYIFKQNTKVVANVTYYHKVEFKIDNNIYTQQFVLNDSYAINPTNPTKSGYEFDGWTINGIDVVDITNININQDIVFIAKFTKLHTVNYLFQIEGYDPQIVKTESIRNGNCSEGCNVDGSNDYYVFNGWSLDGSTIVDTSTYPIYQDITFISSITYFYDVKFIIDNNVYTNQIVEKYYYPTIPTTPNFYGREFIGWSLDGINVVDVTTIEITKSETFVALFNELTGLSERINVGSSTAYSGYTYNGKSYYWHIGKDSSSNYYIARMFSIELETHEVKDFTTLVSGRKLLQDSLFFKDGYLYGFNTSKTLLYKIDLENYTYTSVNFTLKGTSYNWYLKDYSTSPATVIENLSSYKTIDYVNFNCLLDNKYVLYNIRLSSTSYSEYIIMNLKVNYTTGEHELFEPLTREDGSVSVATYKFLGKYENWLIFTSNYSSGYKFKVYDCLIGSIYSTNTDYTKNAYVNESLSKASKPYYDAASSKLYFTDSSYIVEFYVNNDNTLSFVSAINSSTSDVYKKASMIPKQVEYNEIHYCYEGTYLKTYDFNTNTSTSLISCGKTITGISKHKNSIILHCDGYCFVYYLGE